MKCLIKIAAVLVPAMLTGCVVTSVYPFYTAQDVVFDPALIGVWASPDSTNAASEHMRFEKAEGHTYRLTIKVKDDRTEFDTHLFKLNGQLLLDCCPRARPDDFVPPHYLLKVACIEPTLKLNILNYDWLKKLIEKDPKAVRYIMVARRLYESGQGDLVLTADTAELQQFILKYEKADGVFGNGLVMKRWKD